MVGFKFLIWRQVFNSRYTIFLPSESKMLDLLLSEKNNIFPKLQWFADISFCKFKAFHLIYFTKKWFFRGTSLRIFTLWRIFLIVWGITIVPDVEATSTANSRQFRKRFFEDSFTMVLLCLVSSFLGCPVCGLLIVEPVSFLFLIK